LGSILYKNISTSSIIMGFQKVDSPLAWFGVEPHYNKFTEF